MADTTGIFFPYENWMFAIKEFVFIDNDNPRKPKKLNKAAICFFPKDAPNVGGRSWDEDEKLMVRDFVGNASEIISSVWLLDESELDHIRSELESVGMKEGAEAVQTLEWLREDGSLGESNICVVCGDTFPFGFQPDETMECPYCQEPEVEETKSEFV